MKIVEENNCFPIKKNIVIINLYVFAYKHIIYLHTFGDYPNCEQ